MSIIATDLFNRFIAHLNSSGDAMEVWNNRWDTGAWTECATKALAGATKDAMEVAGVKSPHVAARYGRYASRRAEFLSLDVMGFTWDYKVPVVVIEHENTNRKIEYCVWKLLCVDATTRVLVAYYSSKKNFKRYRASVPELEDALRVVLNDQPGKELHVFAGNWDAGFMTSNGWNQVFEHLHMMAS